MSAVATVILILGVGLELIGVLGALVMRDTYDRLHYVAFPSLGATLIALAILITESFSLIADKALATAAVLVLLGPVLVHVTARSLRVRERGDWRAPSAGRAEDQA